MSAYGLLGEHLAHSFSPEIHRQLGGYDYDLFEVSVDGLEAFFGGTALSGMNVTIPYKKAVLPFCSSLSPEAAAIGSVNTLVRQPEGWCGHNTDADGFRFLLRRCGCDPAGKICAVLGTGGASAAVQYVLHELGAAKVCVLSRSGRNDYQHLDDYRDAEIVVNATPVGMYPDNGASPVPDTAFPACRYAVDLIYNPLRTEFLQQMQRRDTGIVCENGLAMLVAQAAKSAELFTGNPVAESEVEELLCKLKAETESIALIGMPGCGKTTVGRILAELLGREFVDLDAEITENTGISPEIWIEAAGEDVFRAAETETLREAAKRTGIVLSCGGGIVMRPENEKLLRQNCRIIWLQKELCKLDVKGRPLSQTGNLEKLCAVRTPLYEQFSDLQADNNGDIAETVKGILEALK